jgi:GT2 family glycosyltransferase
MSKSPSSAVVIICTRNRNENLFRLLQNLNQQTLHLFKVLVVDSSDNFWNSEDLDRARALFGDRLRYIASRPGLPFQRNVGLEYAFSHLGQFETLHFLDDDVSIPSTYLEIASQFLQTHDSFAGVGAWDKNLHPRKTNLFWYAFALAQRIEAGRVLRSGIAVAGTQIAQLTQVQWFPGFGMNFRASALKNFRFDGKYRIFGEDVEAHLRLGASHKLAMTPNLWLWHESSPLGREREGDAQYQSDAVRLRLTKQHPESFSKWLVFWATIGLILGETAFGVLGRRPEHWPRVQGHLRFLRDWAAGKVTEQRVTHGEDDLSPLFVL